MSGQADQPFLDDLSLSLDEAWKLLVRGSRDRKSPLHTPAVASVRRDGSPSQRIMVLREATRESRMLRFNTDRRASKVDDINDGAPIAILGYHPGAKVQLRLSGVGRIEHSSASCDAAWNEATLYGKRCYLAHPAPGSPVDAPTSGLDPEMEGRKPEGFEVAPARENFAVLLAEIDQIEWLYLAHTGHRRALFTWDEEKGQWTSHWLVP
ncbi:flavin-binding protein [Parasphingorhabdus litoris]|uniref:Flavin-binding protein n=1 Tax=Parasphingorhabdus litoris TaxID=394733 RepID=A0ABN1AQN3_9SPHN|nr:pyridoxamine 5'-phosphate oxidase family protein [Parasphingorhabdus litoris]